MKRIITKILKVILPTYLFTLLQKIYHYAFATAGAILYRFPSNHIFIVGITGTKGKSSTAEFINTIFENAGYTTALASTIRFKIKEQSKPNLLKMTMPGRFFMNKFLRDSVSSGCSHAIIEMTSEGVKQFRHKYINLDALIFTNLSPEHIESHGSFENYLNAKLQLVKSLEKSSKKSKMVIANIDDKHGSDFLKVRNAIPIPYSSKDIVYTENSNGIKIEYGDIIINSKLRGEFNVMNILAAVTLAKNLGIQIEIIKKGIESVEKIQGRVEYINLGQPFDVVVDYAHTPDSLEKLYKTFQNKEKICVLGNTGGGRDKWKRGDMGRIAEKYCSKVILTNEDPYDENPEKIISDMADGMKQKPEIVINRREAIKKALIHASIFKKETKKDVIVLISGKGTDPYIMGPHGTKTPWSDSRVVKEEITKLNK